MSQHQGKNTLPHEPDWRTATYHRNGNVRTQRVCRVCSNAAGRAYHARDPGRRSTQYRKYRAAYKDRDRNQRLKRNYGITIEEYNNLLSSQGEVCAICKVTPNGRALDVDHDHETGRIRGLLCMDCNVSLGRFKEDPDLLLTAMGYLL